MDPLLSEWLNLIVRWFHVIAGIMWIGSSLFFIWLENHLVKGPDAKPGEEGEVMMVHGGGYWHVVKRKLQPGALPEPLHWFMWEAYATWLSGFSLLMVVYYLGGKAFLVDPAIADISGAVAIAIGIGSLVVSWLFYDTLWASPLGEKTKLSASLTALYLLGITYVLTHVFTGRAAYIHVGAIIGTMMVGNVWARIIPGQRKIVAAVKAGLAYDPAPGLKARMRSRHNNYFTYPVVFIMISNHFPSTYGNEWNWVILGVLMVAAALVKHFMNISETFKAWLPASLATGAAAVLAMYIITAPRPPAAGAATANIAAGSHGAMVSHATVTPVHFAEAQAIIKQRCTTCHAAKPTDDTFTVAPAGMRLDTPELIQANAGRIKMQAVDTKTMPFANKTGITEAERQTLGRWIDSGAKLD
ncbi:MAG: urate hydroxylase PuuD [Candidatus Sericytochromatia bacterium]|nr:urate hydroxylase PuuD [Candidatus Sericytochromatia bacterium]